MTVLVDLVEECETDCLLGYFVMYAATTIKDTAFKICREYDINVAIVALLGIGDDYVV